MRRLWLTLPLLLAIPVCASLPTTARDGTYVSLGLPPIPTSAPSVKGTIPIRLVPDLQCMGEPAYGCIHHQNEAHVIEIRPSDPLPMKWHTVYHELVHEAIHHAKITLAPALEDSLADAIADQRLADLVTGWPR